MSKSADFGLTPARALPRPLHCPFCGIGNSKTSLYQSEDGYWRVSCGACGASSGHRPPSDPEGAEKVVKAWNHRPEVEAIRTTITRCELDIAPREDTADWLAQVLQVYVSKPSEDQLNLLMADRVRLDWLDQHIKAGHLRGLKTEFTSGMDHEDLRTTIDAAMQEAL